MQSLQDQRDLMGMTNDEGEDIEDYDPGVFVKKKNKLIKVKKQSSY
jgi:hypothetical protein